MNGFKITFFVYIVIILCHNCFGFLSVATGFISYVYNKAVCYSGNCCTENEIPARFDKLENVLQANVYGQPIVQTVVVRALRSHWSKQHNSNKALTMSFHGGTGSGKNYVVKFIEDALYEKGMASPHVHNFFGRVHFHDDSKVNQYKRDLTQWIIGNVTKCPKQLFVFDEADKMPEGVLDAVKPFVDYNHLIDGVDYKQAMFIFLSNTGSHIINERALELWKQGIKRENLKLNDFERLILQGAFNEEGGFHHSDTIKSNLIDHYIPFLPLKQQHIQDCIIDEFRKRGVHSPRVDKINEVMESLDWGPDPDKIYAKTGCKRISQKVSILY